MVRLLGHARASGGTRLRFRHRQPRLEVSVRRLDAQISALDLAARATPSRHSRRTLYTRVDTYAAPLYTQVDTRNYRRLKDGELEEDQCIRSPCSVEGAARWSDQPSIQDGSRQCALAAGTEVGQEAMTVRHSRRTVRVPVKVRTKVTVRTVRCSGCGFEGLPIAFVSPSSSTGVRCPRCGRSLSR